jgi:hypothetical protein
MKTSVAFMPLLLLTAGFCFASDIIYDVDQTVGAGNVTGFIETNGTIRSPRCGIPAGRLGVSSWAAITHKYPVNPRARPWLLARPALATFSGTWLAVMPFGSNWRIRLPTGGAVRNRDRA